MRQTHDASPLSRKMPERYGEYINWSLSVARAQQLTFYHPPSGDTMSDELQQLRDIIVDSVDKILASCGRRNEEFPVLNAPAHSSEFSQKGIRNDPAIIEASTIAISAAAQLIATLQPPAITLANAAGSVRHDKNS